MKNFLFLCDSDEGYCRRLYGFLKEKISIPFEIHGFTDVSKIKEHFLLDNEILKTALLIISESQYRQGNAQDFKNVLILDEKEGAFCEEDSIYESIEDRIIRHTAKYQSCKGIAESVISMCIEMPEFSGKSVGTNRGGMKVISIYTPQRVIPQTEHAISFSRSLADKEHTLYMCTGPICTCPEMIAGDMDESILDLMYYAKCGDDKLSLRIEKIKKSLGNLDFIPVSDVSGDMRDIEKEAWLELISLIGSTGQYETLVIDLYDSACGFKDIIIASDELIIPCYGEESTDISINTFVRELERMDSFDTGNLRFLDVRKNLIYEKG